MGGMIFNAGGVACRRVIVDLSLGARRGYASGPLVEPFMARIGYSTSLGQSIR